MNTDEYGKIWMNMMSMGKYDEYGRIWMNMMSMINMGNRVAYDEYGEYG